MVSMISAMATRFSLGIAFGLSKEGAGLLQQVLEPAVGQGLLSGGR